MTTIDTKETFGWIYRQQKLYHDEPNIGNVWLARYVAPYQPKYEKNNEYNYLQPLYSFSSISLY